MKILVETDVSQALQESMSNDGAGNLKILFYLINEKNVQSFVTAKYVHGVI